MSKQCKACGNPKSSYLMNNKTVCFRCDELLFDIEIECEEETPSRGEVRPTPVLELTKKLTKVE